MQRPDWNHLNVFDKLNYLSGELHCKASCVLGGCEQSWRGDSQLGDDKRAGGLARSANRWRAAPAPAWPG